MSSAASRAHYARLTSPQGKALRDFFQSALADADTLPGRRALRAQAEELAEALGTDVDTEKLVEIYVDFARRAQRNGLGSAGHRFELRGHVDQLASELVARIEAADQLIEQAPDDTDAASAANAALWGPADAAQRGLVDQAMEGGR